jgi:glycine oxidase
MTAPDVIVVGGGIVGASVARALATAGITTEIVDSGQESGTATPASAGMLAPLVETFESEALLGFAVRGRDLYRELAPALADEGGVDIGLWLDGVVKLACTEADETAGRNLAALHRQQGLNTEWLSASEVRDRCPGITPEIRGGLLAPEDGTVEPLAVLEGLLVTATRRGARLTRGEQVVAVEAADGRVTGVRTATGRRPAGAVVIAAGAWSGRIGGLSRPLSVEPVRGQMLAYPWPAEEPGAVVFGAGGYVLQRRTEALVGATMEFAGFDASTTEAGRTRLEEVAGRLYPTLRNATIQRTWTGLRPCTPDGRPIIGQDTAYANLWYATGHGRNGILLAPITGEVVAHLLQGYPSEQLEIDMSPLRPSRFWQF